MREHKYRAWCAHDEMMYYDVQKGIIFDDGSRYGFHNFIETEDPQDYHEWELMQYTGLQDRNGREIFEGDVVRIGEFFDGGVERDDTDSWMNDSLHEVVWGGKEYPAFTLRPEEDWEMNIFSEIICGGDMSIEVVGNIYEHPELLEATNGNNEI